MYRSTTAIRTFSEQAAKNYVWHNFSEWYSSKDQEQLTAGKSAAVDMKLSVLNEASAAWIMGLYDSLRSKPEIINNGFIKAGIEEALTPPATSPVSE